MATLDERKKNARTITDFQLGAASEWIAAARTMDKNKLQFIAYFTAFNAIYWLWGCLDGVARNEIKIVRHLIARLDEHIVKRVSNDGRTIAYITYLNSKERGPVRSMVTRSRDDANGSAKDGTKYHGELESGHPVKKLKAIASILYLVRCNIVHGSKRWAQSENDLATNSIPVLELLVNEAYQFTERKPPT